MKFSVSLQIEVDESGNILAVDEEGWEQDVGRSNRAAIL
jgi:hypothetical protein